VARAPAQPSVGKQAANVLAEHGQWQISPGLKPQEFRDLEARYDIRFGKDHRAFLAAGVPVGAGWPDWRSDDEAALREQIERPVREALDAVAYGRMWGSYWIRRPGPPKDVEYARRRFEIAPPVLPVFESAFTGQAKGNTAVWRIGDAAPALLGHDLADYVRALCGQPRSAPPENLQQETPLWLGREDWKDHPIDLGAPPFDADRPITVPSATPPPEDPAATFTALGIECADLTAHDDLLADGRAWSFALPKDKAAAPALWEQVRAHHPSTGLWPVLVTDHFWSRVGKHAHPERFTVTQLGHAPTGHDWLTARLTERLAEDEPLPRRQWPRHRTMVKWQEIWPARKYPRMDRMLLVPTPANWLVPGLLSWTGAANYDVGPLEHTTMLRRLAARWGIEIIAMDDEMLIMHLAYILSVNDGMAAALEAYLYCPDNVEQGYDSIDRLAMDMMTCTLWDFWWD